MEALSMTKRFRTNENTEYQQHTRQIHQTIQTIKEKALKNDKVLSNLTNKTSDSKRLLNRPSTTSHIYATNTPPKTSSSKSNPSVLYNKLLLNHNTKNLDKKTQNYSVNISNFSIINPSSSTNLIDSSKQNLVNSSNQSSLNSDVFVDRLSDQRIFNRQFKIQNSNELNGNKSARLNGSSKQNYQIKTKQQIYINKPKTFLTTIQNISSAKSNNYKVNDYQSSSIYMDYKNRRQQNSSSVYYNLASNSRNPINDDKNQRNTSGLRKFIGFNLTENSQNFMQKSKNYFEDYANVKSAESLNDINFSTASGIFYEHVNKPIDNRVRSAITENKTLTSPLPTDSPAIVNLLLNNHNKLYETTKIVNESNKYKQNRVPVKLKDAMLESDEKLRKDNEISMDKCTDDFDLNESAQMAVINKKCNDWLEKHVLPHLDSHSNTSSPFLNETN
ncbi:unnamed protein product [Brachionus calyciflorus]|uniref:Uncharacterized protein n=1 Tax=Brachionus calyciflorus TaxID=104777 RepID=A0A814C9L9_9BILA|nr:unnamed protein product [Brachionus calyciflorus]